MGTSPVFGSLVWVSSCGLLCYCPLFLSIKLSLCLPLCLSVAVYGHVLEDSFVDGFSSSSLLPFGF
jgi:hypothetical protein